jgi:hypothetical protein
MSGQKNSEMVERIAKESIEGSRGNTCPKSLPNHKSEHLAQQLAIICVQVLLRHHFRLIPDPFHIHNVSHQF